MSQENNTQAALDAGRAIATAEAKLIHVDADAEGQPAIPVAILKGQNGEQAIVLSEALALADARAEKPRAITGTAVLTDIDSFIAHVNRFKNPDSAVFADRAAVKLQAVYDYHLPSSKASSVGAPGNARWRKHRATYACPLSRQWKLWIAHNEQPFGQEDFGTFIDDNMVDLASGVTGEDFPAPASLLQMARNLVVRSKGTFERKLNPTTGEATLITKDEHEPESTKIYRAFLIGIPVFEGGDPYRVEARLRFSLASGRPQFSYSLFQWERHIEDAFGEICDNVRKGVELPVFFGTTEA